MGGNKEGGKKAHTTLKQRLGEEAYREHMQAIQAKGGRAKVPKGFSVTRKRGPHAQELHEPRQKLEHVHED